MNKLETIDKDSVFQPQFSPKKKLTNSTAVLVLGIISIVVCVFGFITGIVALVLASKDLREYKNNPELFDESSFKNLNAGRICAIIGVCLSVIMILFYTFYFIFIFSMINEFKGKEDFSLKNFPIENNDIFEDENYNTHSEYDTIVTGL